MNSLELATTILSVVYLYFAIKNQVICFVFGILASAIWAYVSFEGHLIYDGVLQLFYVVMSCVGIYRWMYGSSDQRELPITTVDRRSHIKIIGTGVALSLFLYFISAHIPTVQFQFPILDATTTVFLIIGTLLLVDRKLYSWIYLVIADIGCIILYALSGYYLFVGVMVVYIVFGMVGFYTWKKALITPDLSLTDGLD